MGVVKNCQHRCHANDHAGRCVATGQPTIGIRLLTPDIEFCLANGARREQRLHAALYGVRISVDAARYCRDRVTAQRLGVQKLKHASLQLAAATFNHG